jgi:DNA-directed RNA polymerase subunit F
MATPAGTPNTKEISEFVQMIGKAGRGLLALGKEVLPEDTEKFAKLAAEPLNEIREVVVSLKDAMEGRKPGSPLTVRESCRRKQQLNGVDAEALEHALTMAEHERDAAKKQVEALQAELKRWQSPPAA